MPDGQILSFALHLLSQIEHAGIATFGNLVLKLKVEVLELMGKDEVTSAFNLSLAGARALQVDGSVLNVPARRRLVHAVAAPSLECLTIEKGDVAVLVDSEIREVHLCLVHDFKVESGSGRRVFRAFATRTFAIALTIVIAAPYQEQDADSCKEYVFLHFLCF